MAVKVSTQQIREAIQNMGSPPSGLNLSQSIFHQSFAEMIGPDSNNNVFLLFEDMDPDDEIEEQFQHVREFVYQMTFGPRLALNYKQYENSDSKQVLALWAAMEKLMRWLTSIGHRLALSLKQDSWRKNIIKIQKDVPKIHRLELPGWTHSIDIVGAQDMLFQSPKTGNWYAVSLIQSHPVQRELEACLAFILANRVTGPENMPLGREVSLVSFFPERSPTSFSGQSFIPVFPKLLNIIERTANLTS